MAASPRDRVIGESFGARLELLVLSRPDEAKRLRERAKRMTRVRVPPGLGLAEGV
jgi:hypothetical protein